MSEIHPKVKNGNFKVKIPIGNSNSFMRIDETDTYSLFPKDYVKVDTVQHTVPMLSQNEYAHRWNQVLPRKRVYIKQFKNDKNEDVAKISSNVYRMNVNLAQLPYHLWSRMRRIKNQTSTHNYRVNDNIYQYIVEPSNVDDEIRTLVCILNQQHNVAYYEQIRNILTVLKDNDVYGWPVIKAHMYLCNAME
jgi:flagellar basal body rod protein FlgG